jgi:hypothetical protein
MHGPIRLVRQIKVGGILDKGNLTLRIVVKRHMSFDCHRSRMYVCIAPNLGRVNRLNSKNYKLHKYLRGQKLSKYY